jgi:hypothetical protein
VDELKAWIGSSQQWNRRLRREAIDCPDKRSGTRRRGIDEAIPTSPEEMRASFGSFAK